MKSVRKAFHDWIVFTKVYMRDLCEPMLSFTRDKVVQAVLSGREIVV